MENHLAVDLTSLKMYVKTQHFKGNQFYTKCTLSYCKYLKPFQRPYLGVFPHTQASCCSRVCLSLSGYCCLSDGGSLRQTRAAKTSRTQVRWEWRPEGEMARWDRKTAEGWVYSWREWLNNWEFQVISGLFTENLFVGWRLLKTDLGLAFSLCQVGSV